MLRCQLRSRRYCEETPIVTRVHLITGACLLSTGLVMGSINGAVASAEPEGQASSDSSQSSSDSGSDHGTTPNASATHDSASASDDDSGTAGLDHDETRTSPGDDEDELRPPSLRDSNELSDPSSIDTPAPDTTNPATDEVVAAPGPATSGHNSGTTEAKSSSPDTPASAPASTPASSAQNTADLTMPVAVSPGNPPAAPDPAPAPAPAPVPDAAPVQGPPAPAGTTPEPAAPSVTTPGLSAAVAYLLSTLVAAAIEVVTAVIQMVADFRTALGISWAGPGEGDVRLSSAALPENSIALVLKRILSRSLSPDRGSSRLGSALAAGMSLGKVLALTSTLQPAALALAAVRDPAGTHPTPAEGVVTALAAMSLWALLSAALPGLSGLLAAGATGMRIGYRQARAGIALRTTELARFARAGPIGVVRAGALVSMYSRRTPTRNTPRSQQLRLVS